ncbi:MAG: carboxypeptidase-like regulatory domain-containing protein [Chryseolinea sp.]
MLKHYKLNGCSPQTLTGKLFTCMVLLGLLATGPVQAAVTMQPRPVIMLDLKNVSLKSAIREVEKQTDYHFVMNDSRLRVSNKTVTGTIQSDSIEEVLNFLLMGTDILYKIKKKQITLIPPGQAHTLSPVLVRDAGSTARLSQGGVAMTLVSQAETIVTGTVTEADGTALPGVNVVVRGTTRGAVTDQDGKFSISVDSNNDILVFSFIGYVTQEVPLNGQTTLSITLASDTQTLNEVVVMAMVRRRRKMLPVLLRQ